MPDRGRFLVLGAVGGYNLVQNYMVSERAYVPANMVATLGLVALARRNGCTWDELGLNPLEAGRGIRYGLAGAAGAAVVAGGITTLRSARPYLLDERAAGHSAAEITYRAAVRFPLGTALFEEVAFRGVIYGMWRHSGASPRTAAVVTATAFGLWHLIPSGQALRGNPLGARIGTRCAEAGVVMAGALLTGISSLGFGWMRRRSGSLVAPWIGHAAINSFTYLAGVGAWGRSTASTGGGSLSG